MSTFGDALRESGLLSTSERLADVARRAIEQHPLDRLAQRDAVLSATDADAALARELFAAFRHAAANDLLRREWRPDGAQFGAPAPVIAAQA